MAETRNESSYSDASTAIANTFGYMINIFHIPTSRGLSFKAWVQNFSDSYQSNWATEESYGKMDPIATFQNTRRT